MILVENKDGVLSATGFSPDVDIDKIQIPDGSFLIPAGDLPNEPISTWYIEGSLPHRQLRSENPHSQQKPFGSLPHRQLRRSITKKGLLLLCSLPHRQLRRCHFEYLSWF